MTEKYQSSKRHLNHNRKPLAIRSSRFAAAYDLARHVRCRISLTANALPDTLLLALREGMVLKVAAVAAESIR